MCPREASASLCSVSPRHGLAGDTQGRELGQSWGEPAPDSRGGAVLPAEVISHSHLHPTRLLASARSLMDKISCQCLSPSLHPEVGAGSRGVALGTRGWRGSVSAGLWSPRVRQVLAGPVILEVFLEDGWGCWPGSQNNWALRHSHKGTDPVISVTLCLSSSIRPWHTVGTEYGSIKSVCGGRAPVPHTPGLSRLGALLSGVQLPPRPFSSSHGSSFFRLSSYIPSSEPAA